jgi:hypothetical protein
MVAHTWCLLMVLEQKTPFVVLLSVLAQPYIDRR